MFSKNKSAKKNASPERKEEVVQEPPRLTSSESTLSLASFVDEENALAFRMMQEEMENEAIHGDNDHNDN